MNIDYPKKLKLKKLKKTTTRKTGYPFPCKEIYNLFFGVNYQYDNKQIISKNEFLIKDQWQSQRPAWTFIESLL